MLCTSLLVAAFVGLVCSFECRRRATRPIDLPDVSLKSVDGHDRLSLARQALRARRLAVATSNGALRLLVGFIVIVYIFRGSPDCLQAASFGTFGLWTICLLPALPIGLYLTSENKAREVREGSATSVVALDPNLGWQFQYALVKASQPREVTPSQLS
jgi:hypothetical protein